MRDKPIQKGDLVVVNKPLPCGHGGMGIIATVEAIKDSRVGFCLVCRAQVKAQKTAVLSNGRIKLLTRLKRLDHGNISEDIPTKEELTA